MEMMTVLMEATNHQSTVIPKVELVLGISSRVITAIVFQEFISAMVIMIVLTTRTKMIAINAVSSIIQASVKCRMF